ncbi:glyoxylase-like metal-dependent hydrolase (beta-lactamase superfamily II) [Pullulanibacillus pueri]|uniref:Metallo-beta-lactamase domain-containing protein n=1 Tax=Pullulanibacillus pueri TaxID=1437324 RepID=A0A8J2ZYY0_9BACL|nr:MBL fold metallo-hydrolase [Pullulanibacillus pueri]MBM7680683.1 glyoxylase-like metal-dependent hydrolase (beta-lactamase superfamily II) [Pullulanibacillus pueri]GGH87493.1 hypothetical protein GCM10007096_37630 [Pullulanibacillus pueri]
MSKGISSFLRTANLGSLRRIVLTHGHSDHVGALSDLIDQYNVPIYAHKIEQPFMEGELAYPRRKKAQKTVQVGWVQPLSEDMEGKLLSVGGLVPYHVPGHSPGHVVYYHERDNVLLAGDAFTSKKGKLRKPMPMFTADMKMAVKCGVDIVRRLNPERLEVCHGNPVFHPFDQIDDYFKANMSIRHSKGVGNDL